MQEKEFLEIQFFELWVIERNYIVVNEAEIRFIVKQEFWKVCLRRKLFKLPYLRRGRFEKLSQSDLSVHIDRERLSCFLVLLWIEQATNQAHKPQGPGVPRTLILV